jgi:hypothetical protein
MQPGVSVSLGVGENISGDTRKLLMGYIKFINMLFNILFYMQFLEFSLDIDY